MGSRIRYIGNISTPNLSFCFLNHKGKKNIYKKACNLEPRQQFAYVPAYFWIFAQWKRYERETESGYSIKIALNLLYIDGNSSDWIELKLKV